MPIKDIPAEARPREKLLSRGPGALSDAELLAILLRTGIAGKGVLQMAEELLQIKNDSASRTTDGRQGGFGGIAGLLHATADDLKRVKGLGPAKRAEIVAVLELARRAMAQRLQEREVFADPQVVARGLKVEMAHPTAGTVALVANPVRLSASPVQYRLPPPLLGQHTDEVLGQWLGLGTTEIDGLRERKVV